MRDWLSFLKLSAKIPPAAIRCSDLLLLNARDWLSFFKIMSIIKTIPIYQVEMHPVWQQKKLVNFCKEKGILVTAYSPLGGNSTPWGTQSVMECDVLKEIARTRGKSLPQVLYHYLSCWVSIYASIYQFNLSALRVRNIKSWCRVLFCSLNWVC